MKKSYLTFIFLCTLFVQANGQTIITIAGNGIDGDSGDNGPAITASLNVPYGGCFDRKGNFYFVEAGANRVRRISFDSIITTIAGTGTGGYNGDNIQATAAEVYLPEWVATDAIGNIYIADEGNRRERKIDTAGIIHTIAGNGVLGYGGDGGLADTTSLAGVGGACVDIQGNIYVCDDSRVLKINTSGIISTIAGTGIVGFSGDSGLATNAQVQAREVYIDSLGNLYIADFNRIRKIDVGTNIIHTIAGTGSAVYNGDGIPANSADIYPIGLAWDSFGNLYTADLSNNRVRKIDTGGIIHTIAGTGVAGFSGDGGLADTAKMYDPSGVAFDPCGNLYVPCKQNFRIRKVIFDSTCGQADTTHTDTTNAVQNVKGGGFSVYPNPASKDLTLTLSIYGEGINSVLLYNMLGQVVYDKTFVEQKKITIDISALPNGVYFVKVNPASGGTGDAYVQKVLKE